MKKENLVKKWDITGFLNGINDIDNRIELSQLLEDIKIFLSYNRYLPDGIFFIVMVKLYRTLHETDYKKIHSIFVSWYNNQDYRKYLYSNNKNGDEDLITGFEEYYFMNHS